jgi:hypothetical protein
MKQIAIKKHFYTKLQHSKVYVTNGRKKKKKKVVRFFQAMICDLTKKIKKHITIRHLHELYFYEYLTCSMSFILCKYIS